MKSGMIKKEHLLFIAIYVKPLGMKKWLLVLGLIGIFFVLSWLNKNKLQKRFPILQRIDRTVRLAAWIILLVYALVIISWLF